MTYLAIGASKGIMRQTGYQNLELANLQPQNCLCTETFNELGLLD